MILDNASLYRKCLYPVMHFFFILSYKESGESIGDYQNSQQEADDVTEPLINVTGNASSNETDTPTNANNQDDSKQQMDKSKEDIESNCNSTGNT